MAHANDDGYDCCTGYAACTPIAEGNWGGVILNDSFHGTTVSATLVSSSSHGSLNLNSDGTFCYQPNSGYTGTDTFTYYITDDHGNSNTATVTISVLTQSDFDARHGTNRTELFANK